ncbi:MAG TPA: hypothetical protein VLB83_05355, partial [Candidatus Paceibacterota bacterium]|nr:hypothetical protein [Candidatus Paceibacterota bacterium]
MEYLKHTLSHIAGALAVLVIAVLVGYVARAQTTYDMGSSTGTMTAMPVYFSASKIDEVCVGGIMHHRYAFSITPVSGGYISLDNAIFVDDLHMNFQQTVAPGSHTWAGYARSGYMLASGSVSGGAVSIPSVACTANTTTSTTNTTTTATGDTMPPSTPTGVMAAGATGGGIKIAWNAATDNVGVTMYIVYRNGASITETSLTNFHDVGVTPGSVYSYSVAAVDAARNVSSQSAIVMATAPTILATDPASATKYVSLFTVQPSQSTECVNGAPMTHVGFFFETGAYVTITRNLGNGFTAYEAGDRLLPNDTYRWVGKARTDLGYALTSGGVHEGTFTLNAACSTNTETTFDLQSSTTAPATGITFAPGDDFVPGQPMVGLVM